MQSFLRLTKITEQEGSGRGQVGDQDFPHMRARFVVVSLQRSKTPMRFLCFLKGTTK